MSTPHVITGAAMLLLLAGCGARQRAPEPAAPANLGYGTEIDLRNSPRRIRSIPGWQLRSAGPMGLEDVLKSRGLIRVMGPAVFIDGVEIRWGSDAVEGLPLEEIERVDLLEGLWGGLAGTSTAVSIITKRR